MAIKTTRWRPDTCACVVEYTWDTDDPEDTRSHTQRRIVRRCAAHQADIDTGFLARLLIENRRVGTVAARLAEAFPALADAVRDRLSFQATRDADDARVLTVSLPAVTALQRTVLQTWCDNRFGAGRVQVED